MPDQQVNIIVPKDNTPTIKPNPNLNAPLWQGTAMINTLGPEGYVFAKETIDEEALYLNELTRLLYCGVLTKTGEFDPKSPLPFYRLIKLGYDTDPQLNEWKPNINFGGYMAVANNTLLFVNRAISMTKFEKRFKVLENSISNTMSIADMMVSNSEEWQFQNETLLNAIGRAIFMNIYSIAARSVEGDYMKRTLRPQEAPLYDHTEGPNKKKWGIGPF
jgi:hypothetical protein